MKEAPLGTAMLNNKHHVPPSMKDIVRKPNPSLLKGLDLIPVCGTARQRSTLNDTTEMQSSEFRPVKHTAQTIGFCQ